MNSVLTKFEYWGEILVVLLFVLINSDSGVYHVTM